MTEDEARTVQSGEPLIWRPKPGELPARWVVSARERGYAIVLVDLGGVGGIGRTTAHVVHLHRPTAQELLEMEWPQSWH